jgi:hypothetical protein
MCTLVMSTLCAHCAHECTGGSADGVWSVRRAYFDDIGKHLTLCVDLMEIVKLVKPLLLDVFGSGTCGQQETHDVKLLDLDPQRSADGGKHGESMRSCWKQNLVGVSFAIVGDILIAKSSLHQLNAPSK